MWENKNTYFSSPRPSHQNLDQFTRRHSHMPWLQDELGRWNPNHFHCCWRNPSKVDLCDTKRNDESASESKKRSCPQKTLDLVFPQSNEILLMEDILHHLGCIKPCKWWDNLTHQLVQDFFHQQYVHCVHVSLHIQILWHFEIYQLLPATSLTLLGLDNKGPYPGSLQSLEV